MILNTLLCLNTKDGTNYCYLFRKFTILKQVECYVETELDDSPGHGKRYYLGRFTSKTGHSDNKTHSRLER